MACKHCEACETEEHVHKEQEEEKGNKGFVLYGLSILLFTLGFIPGWEQGRIFFYLASVLLAGSDLILKGIYNIFHLDFEEETLMAIAVIAAFLLGDFPESCLVVLLFKLGEFLEDKAVEKSKANIEDIVKIKANTANRMKNEKIEIVPVEEIKVGDMILIKPGEKVPVDCITMTGDSTLDTSPITGESNPKEVHPGENVLSGSINLKGAITAKVEKDVENSLASKIVDLVYEATNNKGKTEKFMTKFSRIYTPTVIALAVLIAVIPWLFGADFAVWLERALVFLVASCPCSLVISVPLAFFSCVGAISKQGMIVKGTKHIENLAKASTVAFDKTGTLTTGKMVIDVFEIKKGLNKKELLEEVYALEKLSNHPISTAIKKEVGDIVTKKVQDYEEIPGHGLRGKIAGKEILVGNERLLKKFAVSVPDTEQGVIRVAVNGETVGSLKLKEEVRKEAEDIASKLWEQGIDRVIMLTGDGKEQAEKMANRMKIKEVYAQLLPQDKMNLIKEIQKEKQKVIFIGDGINDSPVLATADFGIAMGAGTEIASSTADSILISDNIGVLPNVLRIAKKGMKIIKQNIIFSLVIKFIVLVLGIIGFAPVWAAVAADTGVTVLTVLNAIRIFK